jgi:hypothetical protein
MHRDPMKSSLARSMALAVASSAFAQSVAPFTSEHSARGVV